MLDQVKTVAKKYLSPNFSIRTITILFFVLLICFVGTLLIGINQYALHTIAMRYAKDFIEKKELHLKAKINNYFRPLNYDILQSAELIRQNIVIPGNNLLFIQYLYDQISQEPYVFGTLWATPKGEYYIVDRAARQDFFYTHNLQQHDKKYISATKIDNTGNLGETKLIPDAGYDMRTRPWYIAAVNQQGPIWTGIYPFLNILKEDQYPSMGVTAAVPIYNLEKKLRGVIELSISMQGILEFISEINITPNSIVFLADQENKLIAISKNIPAKQFLGKTIHFQMWENLGVPMLPQKKFSSLDSIPGKVTTYIFKNKTYLVIRDLIPNIGNTNWHLTIIVPEADLLAPLHRAFWLAGIITLIALLIGFLIANFISLKISQPIIGLVQEANLIQKLKLKNSIKIKSNIREIHTITSAFEAMKKSLLSFQCYVPTVLIRKLLSSGQAARAGGQQKTISILFCDIKNYTHLAENMQPDKLIDYLSIILEAMSNIISGKHGTVDKYIGDAVMAFWNAPLSDAHHALDACECALLIQAKVKELNAGWQGEYPELTMRIGVNTGSAIVGNIGSSERLNYTAIGNSVNLASYLITAGKTFDTLIVISEDTYELVKHVYDCRLLGKIQIKNKEQLVCVYELTGRL